MRPANLLLLAAAAAIPLTTSCVVADGIPGVVMTDSQYLTDWSGFYIGGKLGGAFSSNINWHQELDLFTANSGVAPNTPIQFSPGGVASSGAPTFSLGSGSLGPRCRSRAPTCLRRSQARFFPRPIHSQPRLTGSSQGPRWLLLGSRDGVW